MILPILPWGRIALVAAVCLTVLGAALAIKGAVRDIEARGYKRGRAEAEAAASKAALDQVAANVARSNGAVTAYVAEIAAREPRVIRVTSERIRYEASPAAAAPCLDADGVRLIEDHRDAIGYLATTAGGGGDVPLAIPAGD